MFQVNHSPVFWVLAGLKKENQSYTAGTPPQVVHFIWENHLAPCGSTPGPKRTDLTLAQSQGSSFRLLASLGKPKDLVQVSEEASFHLLCPLSETHSALNLDPPFPTSTSPHTPQGGIWEARLGEGGQCRENGGEPGVPHVPVLDLALTEAPCGEPRCWEPSRGQGGSVRSCRAYSLARQRADR